MLAQSTHSW